MNTSNDFSASVISSRLRSVDQPSRCQQTHFEAEPERPDPKDSLHAATNRLRCACCKTASACCRVTPGNQSANSSIVAPASRFSNSAVTGTRVPANSHAPLALQRHRRSRACAFSVKSEVPDASYKSNALWVIVMVVAIWRGRFNRRFFVVSERHGESSITIKGLGNERRAGLARVTRASPTSLTYAHKEFNQLAFL